MDLKITAHRNFGFDDMILTLDILSLNSEERNPKKYKDRKISALHVFLLPTQRSPDE